MTRKIALVLCGIMLALSLAVLAGCGKKEPAGTPKTTQDADAKAKAALATGNPMKKGG
jgi:predicted small lipoprotein YifL